MKSTATLNGVDTEALVNTVNAIKSDPKLAQCKFRAKNQWIEGGHNCASVKEFYAAGQEDTTRTKPFELKADEPPVLLGTDLGANPVEYLLSALSGCMTTSMVYHAAANGVKIDELESAYEGDLDLQGFLGLSDSVRPGFQAIRVTFRVKTDGTTEQLESYIKRSPVFDVVSRSVPVTVRIEKK
jgi:uncharacterized OsmC-like protein